MRVRAALAALLILLLAPRATAETIDVPPSPVFLRILSNSSLRRDTNPDVETRLPPVVIIEDSLWQRMDAEHRRLEDAEKRLTAENQVLRSGLDTWQPGWEILVAAAAVGVAGGFYLGYKLNPE